MKNNERNFSSFGEAKAYAQLCAFLLQEPVDLKSHPTGWMIVDQLVGVGLRNELALIALVGVATDVRIHFNSPAYLVAAKEMRARWIKANYLTNAQSALQPIEGSVKHQLMKKNPSFFLNEEELMEHELLTQEYESIDYSEEKSNEGYIEAEWSRYVENEITQPIKEELGDLREGAYRSGEEGWFYED